MLKRGFNVAGITLISGGTDLPTPRELDAHRLGDARRRHGRRRSVLQEDARPSWERRPTRCARRRRNGCESDICPPSFVSTASRIKSETISRWSFRVIPGLAPDRIDRKKLILSSQNWLGAFPIDGKRALTSDYRRSAPIVRPWMPAALRYLRRQLGYRTDLPYLGVDGGETVEQGFAPTGKYPASMNSRWVHSAIYDATPEQFAKAREDFAKAGHARHPARWIAAVDARSHRA